MRHIMMAAALGSALTLVSGGSSSAGTSYADPQVIPGLGPETTVAQVYQPGVGYVRPQAGSIGYRELRSAGPRRASLGGGLLEAVLGDGSPNPPAQTRPIPAYPGARVAYNSSEPQADPYATPDYAVRPTKAMDPMFQRQEVAYGGDHAPGSIVIDTKNKFLYLVQSSDRALRYGIGVGRPGFLWTGTKVITRKAEWPDWTPPAEMIKRRPDLPGHMAGGIANPLGARAMYLGSSLYRIHGTNEPDTIGTNVSSGCIRLTNDDVSDLFGRVKVGTHVFVM